MPSLWTIFLTGLLTGGITCVAVQGGLLVSLIATQKAEDPRLSSQIRVVAQFLSGKLIGYAIMGGLLGLLGSVVTFSPKFYGVTQIIAAFFMLGVAGAILEIHPIFRYFLWQGPRSAGKLIRGQSRSSSKFAGLLMGLLTVFIPCGTTQAMMATAAISGQVLKGALVMTIFTIGTMPLFVLFGLGLASIGKLSQKTFGKLAAGAIAVIALTSLNAGLVLAGSQVYPSQMLREVYCTISFCGVDTSQPTEKVAVQITRDGYQVDNTVIKAGKKITVDLNNVSGGGCQQAFSVPSLGVTQLVGMGESAQISFDAPEKPGTLAFSCSMGMYEGQFTVVN